MKALHWRRLCLVSVSVAVAISCGGRDSLLIFDDDGLSSGGATGFDASATGGSSAGGTGAASGTGGDIGSVGGGPGTGGAIATGGGPGTGGAISNSCGDGVLDPGEMCEGGNLNGETCATVTMGSRPLGGLGCSAVCTFVTAECFGGGTVGGTGGVTGVGGGPATGGVGGAGAFGGGGMGAFGGGGSGGAGGMGAFGGTTNACVAAFCPPTTFGSACCLTPTGPCGIDFGTGCFPRPGGVDGGN